MKTLTTKDLAFTSITAAIWAALNVTIVPLFWQATRLPILCDLIGVSLFVTTAWWTRKPGAVTLMGLVTTLLNFALRPGALHFLGFTAAAIFYDAATLLAGYQRLTTLNSLNLAVTLVLSLCSTAIAGAIIGFFFMPPAALGNYGGVAAFTLLHAAGGGIGGLLGLVIVKELTRRGIQG
ncbi:MAG TPA: hypothetical protein ENF19_03465 [Candidatus Bathyarchaeota archaeon]|nr:hypothetical protein [Candidatus Bathyarchaeota archaeon]